MQWLIKKRCNLKRLFFYIFLIGLAFFVLFENFFFGKRFLSFEEQDTKNVLRPLPSKIKTRKNYTTNYVEKPPLDTCNGVGIIVLIKTAPNHFELRQVIRDTWASVHNVSGHRIQTIFLLGITGNRTTNLLLTKEASEYNDILIGSFIDSYLNLTVKSSFGLRWIREYCREPSFVILGDDDTYMKLNWIARHYLGKSPREEGTLHCGHIFKKGKVLRSGPYKIPFDFYAQGYYPPYCSGPCYMMPTDVAISISLALTLYPDALTHRIKVEDALLTGIIREHIGYPITSMPTTMCQHLKNSEEIVDKIINAWLSDEKRISGKKWTWNQFPGEELE